MRISLPYVARLALALALAFTTLFRFRRRRRGTVRLTLEPLGPRVTPARYWLPFLNFSPYIAQGENPNFGPGQVTLQELTQRLQTAAQYTDGIRTFDNTGDLAPAAALIRGLGKTAAIGTFLNGTVANDQPRLDALFTQAVQGNVDIAILGNETQQFGTVSETALVGYITQFKARLAAANLAIPVTTADTYNALLAHPNVLAAVDVVWGHVYPFFEATTIDLAVSGLSRNFRLLQAAVPGKAIVLGETGWPWSGSNGVAVPSPQNAARYFLEVSSWARNNGVTLAYFEAFDEPWKTNEGTFGPHWGLLNASLQLKPGLRAVFDGATTATPFIDFFAGPATTRTNIPTAVVAGLILPGQTVAVNGVPLAAAAYDGLGAYVHPVPLAVGTNAVTVTVRGAGGQVVRSATKAFVYDTTYSTADLQLIYVDVVNAACDGTVVVDVGNNAVLGLLAGRHVRGIAPNGREVYMDTRAVVSTATHATLRTLPFAQPIASNGFVVSPIGTRLFSATQVVDVATNALLLPLSVDITTGNGFTTAAIPGGPAVTADGSAIFAGNPVVRINTVTGAATATGIVTPGAHLSDIELSADGTKLLLSTYGAGGLSVYDATTFQLQGQVPVGDFSGEIRPLAGGTVVIGSAGNPANLGGGVTVAGLAPPQEIHRVRSMIADNLATNASRDAVFVTSGERAGVDVFGVGSDGRLTLLKTFVLGVNQFFRGTGIPSNDHVRAIVYKAGAAVAPAVASVAVIGEPGQRSRVTSVTVTFNTQVAFANPANVAAAFQLARIGGGTVGGFTATVAIVDGATAVTLSDFTGTETQFGSLVDGRYTLVVRANQVTNLDGDGNSTGGDNYVLNGTAVNGLFRYYGDLDGDGDVDGTDLVAFVPTLFNPGNYIAALDFDGDGDVDGTDLFEFVQNLFVPLP